MILYFQEHLPMLDPFRYVNQISWISKFQMSLTTKKKPQQIVQKSMKKRNKMINQNLQIAVFFLGKSRLSLMHFFATFDWDLYNNTSNNNARVASDTSSFQNPVLPETCSAKGCLCQ